MSTVEQTLSHYLPIPPEVLLVIASAWPRFRQIARTVLTAAGCGPEAILCCDTHIEGWQRPLVPAAIVLCDVVTAASLPDQVRRMVFALVSETSLAQLKTFERFFAE